MRQATTGDTVRVHYTGTLADGTEFDSSMAREPIELTLGGGQVIPGFESALMGMAEGDSKSVTLEPDDAYGPHQPELVKTIERARIPPEIDLQVGASFHVRDAGGNPVSIQIVEFDADSVTVDLNHPLAGLPLTFELELVGFV